MVRWSKRCLPQMTISLYTNLNIYISIYSYYWRLTEMIPGVAMFWMTPHVYIYIYICINCTFVNLCTCFVQNVFSRGALGAHIGAVSAGIFGVGWLRLLTNIALKWIIIGKYKVLRKQKKTSRKSCELQVVTKLYMTFCMIGDFRLMSGIGKTKIETQSKSSSDNRDTFEWF